MNCGWVVRAGQVAMLAFALGVMSEPTETFAYDTALCNACTDPYSCGPKLTACERHCNNNIVNSRLSSGLNAVRLAQVKQRVVKAMLPMPVQLRANSRKSVATNVYSVNR